jgi:predicted nucleotidyltransferase
MPVNTDARAAIGDELARCACVRAAWVFGSVAEGRATATSDLDVAVLLATGPAPEDRDALALLSVRLEKFSPSGRVDIVILGEQGPVFRHRVLRTGVLVLDRDPSLRKAFEADTIVDYLDWKPTHDLAMSSALEGIRRRLDRGLR